MANLFLTNMNPESQHQYVDIDLVTRVCVFDNEEEIRLDQLLGGTDFRHTLFAEPYIPAIDDVFYYEYDDVDGLLNAPIYVYSTCLHVKNPSACQFRITPSPKFQRAPFQKNIYFSMSSDISASKLISIFQLEAFISEMGGYDFEFSEDTLIDTQLTIHDLPMVINGDLLYCADPYVVELLKVPIDFGRYELRYISAEVGLGVFARENIPSGDTIAVYTGVKAIQSKVPRNYTYVAGVDALNLELDARPHGNIARFINHAPSAQGDVSSLSCSSLLSSNIKSVHHSLKGVVVIVYVAKREILRGEQLLVDYGHAFFKVTKMRRFEENGQLVGRARLFFDRIKEKEVAHKRIMAAHGLHEAQTFMLVRLCKVLLVILVLICLFNYLF